MSDNDDTFTPGKFMPRAGNEPVVGWVKVTAEIKRAYAEQVQRAVVVSDADVETLKTIREWIYNNPESFGDDGEQIALLDRLIGKGR